MTCGVPGLRGQEEPGGERPAKEWSFHDRSSWTTAAGSPAGSGWVFEGDEIRLEEPGGGSGGNIFSQTLPPNFELSWDWKIESKVNGGLKYRVRRFDEPDFGGQYLGLEYQIIDDGRNLGSIGSTASIYDLVPPAADTPLKAVGEWNTARVVAVGERIEHYLNGRLVAQADLSTTDWERRIALSKFYGAEGFGLPRPGDRVMLTDHGGRASYKNIRLTPVLEPDKPADANADSSGPFLTDGMTFARLGRESAVVTVRTTQLGDEQGAPGLAGKVRATYWPGWQRHKARETPWSTTAAGGEFTASWELKDLQADTTYHVVVEASQLDADETTDVVRDSFCTAP